jgi:hypothetical protein
MHGVELVPPAQSLGFEIGAGLPKVVIEVKF